MDASGIFWTAVPIVFTGGGAYALFRYRLNKMETAVERMAETCIQNRTLCAAGIGQQIASLRLEIKEDFEESKEDRTALRDQLHQIDVKVARLDQKLLNGK